MKDFDAERSATKLPKEERTFRLHEELFVLKTGVRPETLARLDAYSDIKEDASVADAMEALDSLFLVMVESDDDAETRYRRIREIEDDPITLDELQAVLDWMTDALSLKVEEETGRPTGSPSASGGGRKRTGTRSTGDSSSPVVKAA